jgi:hypothetical protein
LDRSFTPFDVRAGQKGKSNNPFGPDTSQVLRQHLAFEVPKERFHEAVQMLKKSGVHITDFFGKETEEGSVHPWMPIVSVYFSDPDGHVLERLSKLPDEPQPDCYPMSYSEWRQTIEKRVSHIFMCVTENPLGQSCFFRRLIKPFSRFFANTDLTACSISM